MTVQESLWSAQEVRTQAEQCAGQVTVWDALDDDGAPCCYPFVTSGGSSHAPDCADR